MLSYFDSGERDFSLYPVAPNRRPGWEFFVSLGGSSLGPVFDEKSHLPKTDHPTLWAFPPLSLHGWVSDGKTNRIVFHHTQVPTVLEENLPSRGFYTLSLTSSDCQRFHDIEKTTRTWLLHPTPLRDLQTQTLIGELSLMALRDSPLPSSSLPQQTDDRVDQAVIWFLEHLNEDPKYIDICKAVECSPAHLRHLFHKHRQQSPREVFQKMRMEVIRNYLSEANITLEDIASRVGFSSASALSRAVKSYFGHPPLKVRNWRVSKNI